MAKPYLTDAGRIFRENEILFTGASGFLGKVTLALLLDRYPSLRHVHVLIRPRSSMSASERFNTEILNSPVFAGLLVRRGERAIREKISLCVGDVSESGFGLSSGEMESLRGRVRLIINCAGTVDFFPPVDQSLQSNVAGVENAVALAKYLGAKLLHVSTCFVSGEADGLVEETEPILGFYPHRKGLRDHSFDFRREIEYCREQIRLIHESGENARGKETAQRLIALGKRRAEHWGWVNTYTYSKSLGEQIIASEKKLDWAIVRPAIVESALRFPFPGWIEGGRTAAPLVLMALGGLRHWPVRRDTPLDVVPVDLVAAAILNVAALLLDERHRAVYQLGTADVNPVKLGMLVNLLRTEAQRRSRRNGGERSVVQISGGRGRARFVSLEQARARRLRLDRRIERAQAILDRMNVAVKGSRLPGSSSLSRWQSALRKIGLRARFREQTLDQYLPFVLYHRYIFECENIRAARSAISEKDRLLLPWDPEGIHWKDYWIHHQIKGIETWIQPEAVKEWAFRI